MESTWVSPKVGGEFSELGIIKGCSELDPLGHLCLALVSRVGAVVIVVTGGVGGGV